MESLIGHRLVGQCVLLAPFVVRSEIKPELLRRSIRRHQVFQRDGERLREVCDRLCREDAIGGEKRAKGGERCVIDKPAV